jgi:tetratricopeptide (TPR) repeat protein
MFSMRSIADKNLFLDMNRPLQPRTLAALIVFIITLLVYLPSLGNEFVNWDDNQYVYNNRYIKSSPGNVLSWAFSSFQVGNWHPLTWMSHAIDYTIWGLNPLGHHLSSIVLHSLNAMMVVFLCMRLLESYRRKKVAEGFGGRVLNGNEVLIAAATTGILFGIHPVHVESVAWVSERKDVLSALFFCLSILSYIRYVDETENGIRAGRWASRVDYLFSFAFFICALLSKPMVVTLPFVLILLDWFPFKRIQSLKTFGKIVLEKAPFIALSVASSVITVFAQIKGKSLVTLEASSVPARIMIAADALFSYLTKMVLPLSLSPFYPYPKGVSFFSVKYLFSLLAITIITLVCIKLFLRGRNVWLAVWGYYLITLLPVLGIIRVGMQSMADRYTYLPSLGPFLVLGLAVGKGYEKLYVLKQRGLRQEYAGVVIACILVVLMSFLTIRQTRVWRNSIVLWTYVIKNSQVKIPFAYNNRGSAYNVAGEHDLAIQDFDAAIALEPEYTIAFNNRGLAYESKGMYDLAISDFTKAIALQATYFDAINNRGVAYNNKGMYDQAIQDFTRIIKLRPKSFEAYNNRATAYAGKGLFEKAEEDFSRALTLRPDYFEALCNLGLALKLNGKYERSVEIYTRAIKLSGNNAIPYINRAYARLKMGDTLNAVTDFRKGCALGNKTGCRELKNLVKD